MPVLETDRLILRRFTLDDVEALTAIQADPEFARVFGNTATIDETRGLIEWSMRVFDEKGVGFLATVLKQTGELIGRCGLLLQDVEGVEEGEVAYGIASWHWGRGLATEAARALKEHGFRDHGFPRLISLILPENIASQRVAEKNGMRYDRDVTKWNMRFRLYVVERSIDAIGDSDPEQRRRA